MALESITPEDAVELYLETRHGEVATSTFRSQKSRLQQFVTWCDKQGHDDMAELSGRDLHQYVLHLREYFLDGNGGDPSPATIQTRCSTIRVFLRFCEDIDAVPENFAEKVSVPDYDPDEYRRNAYLHSDDAQIVLDALEQTQYATREHAVFLLAWRTAARIGTLRSFDVADLDTDTNQLSVVHRPDSDTPLKKQSRGERVIALQADVVAVVTDYIDSHRYPVQDDYGRDPLFTTRHGRAAKSTLRATLYRAQLPCVHSNECPHGQQIVSCPYNTDKQRTDCPSTVRPHSIRRGGVTRFLNDGIPETVVGDRVDMSTDVMDNHYDQRTETEKAEVRRQHFT